MQQPIKIQNMKEDKPNNIKYVFLLYPKIGTVSENNPHIGFNIHGIEVMLYIFYTSTGVRLKSSL